jgi:DNA-binding transcriptional regulator YdaS (Cro superfamily)
MNLHDYLSRPGALSVSELAKSIGAPDPAQVRQWRHGYNGRKPDAPYCVAIEQATNGAVTRQDLRPDDWQKIWPELIPNEEVKG